MDKHLLQQQKMIELEQTLDFYIRYKTLLPKDKELIDLLYQFSFEDKNLQELIDNTIILITLIDEEKLIKTIKTELINNTSYNKIYKLMLKEKNEIIFNYLKELHEDFFILYPEFKLIECPTKIKEEQEQKTVKNILNDFYTNLQK